jgi:hypothetical protein
MRRRDLLAGLSLVPLAAPAVAQCVLPGFPRSNLRGRCEGAGGIALDFLTPGSLDPRITLTRASTGSYFDSAGVMQTAAINAGRWDYDPTTLALRGMLLEGQRTNGVRNSTMVGAAPGTPGTLPTNWVLGGSPAVVPQVVGTGTESGIPYIDLRLTGTASSAIITLLPETTTAIVASNGQSWTASWYIRLTAGTLNGITNVQPLINETTAAGAGVKNNFGPLIQASGAALASQRGVYSVPLTGGGTVGAVHPRLQFNITNGAALEATFRLGAPQMELGAFVTSYISTSTVAVTRSPESMTASVPTGTYATETVGGTVNVAGVTYAGTASSAAGVLTFAWPAAAVTAGERHLRRLVLR